MLRPREPVGEANRGSGRCPGYLKHNDEGQADGQKVPVGLGILPIVFPERAIPAGKVGLGVGSRAGDFWASPPRMPCSYDSGSGLP